MSCVPNPQLLNPCADDSVGSLSALGTRGDVAYDEHGFVQLTPGQTEVVVQFSYEKASGLGDLLSQANYIFEYLYVTSPNGEAIVPTVKSRTTKGFTVELSGSPTSQFAELFWRVVAQDSLQACQPLSDGPRYAIFPTPQEGVVALPDNQNFLSVVFPVAQPDDSWNFEAFSIEKQFDIGGDIDGWTWTVKNRSATGFTVLFSANTNSDYSLHWKIA